MLKLQVPEENRVPFGVTTRQVGSAEEVIGNLSGHIFNVEFREKCRVQCYKVYSQVSREEKKEGGEVFTFSYPSR